MLLIRSWKSIRISFSGRGRGQHDAARIESFGVVDVAALLGNRAIMSPMYSFGQMTKAFTIGSSISAMTLGVRKKGGIVHLIVLAVGQRDS